MHCVNISPPPILTMRVRTLTFTNNQITNRVALYPLPKQGPWQLSLRLYLSMKGKHRNVFLASAVKRMPCCSYPGSQPLVLTGVAWHLSTHCRPGRCKSAPLLVSKNWLTSPSVQDLASSEEKTAHQRLEKRRIRAASAAVKPVCNRTPAHATASWRLCCSTALNAETSHETAWKTTFRTVSLNLRENVFTILHETVWVQRLLIKKTAKLG